LQATISTQDAIATNHSQSVYGFPHPTPDPLFVDPSSQYFGPQNQPYNILQPTLPEDHHDTSLSSNVGTYNSTAFLLSNPTTPSTSASQQQALVSSNSNLPLRLSSFDSKFHIEPVATTVSEDVIADPYGRKNRRFLCPDCQYADLSYLKVQYVRV
jgi:hypothetical protein